MTTTTFLSLPYDIHESLATFFSLDTIEALLQTSKKLRIVYDPVANYNKHYFRELEETIEEQVLELEEAIEEQLLELEETTEEHTLERLAIYQKRYNHADQNTLYRLLIWRGIEWIKQFAYALNENSARIRIRYETYYETAEEFLSPDTTSVRPGPEVNRMVLFQNKVRMRLISTVFHLLDEGPFPPGPFTPFDTDEEKCRLETLDFILTTPLFGDGSVWADGHGRWLVDETGKISVTNRRPCMQPSQNPAHLKHLLYLVNYSDDMDHFCDKIMAAGNVKAMDLLLSYMDVPYWLTTSRPTQCRGPEDFENACAEGNTRFAAYLLPILKRGLENLGLPYTDAEISSWAGIQRAAHRAVDLPHNLTRSLRLDSISRPDRYTLRYPRSPNLKPSLYDPTKRTWARWRMTRCNKPEPSLSQWNDQFSNFQTQTLALLDLLRASYHPCPHLLPSCQGPYLPTIFFRTLFKPDLFSPRFFFCSYKHNFPAHLTKSDSDLYHWRLIKSILGKLLNEYAVDPNLPCDIHTSVGDYYHAYLPHYDTGEIFPSLGCTAIGRVLMWVFECARGREEEGRGMGLQEEMKGIVVSVLRLLVAKGGRFVVEERDKTAWEMWRVEMGRYWRDWGEEIGLLLRASEEER